MVDLPAGALARDMYLRVDGKPSSANGLWEAEPGWGVTFGYPEKAARLHNSASSSCAPPLEIGLPFLFCEFSPLMKKNFKILFLESS